MIRITNGTLYILDGTLIEWLGVVVAVLGFWLLDILFLIGGK